VLPAVKCLILPPIPAPRDAVPLIAPGRLDGSNRWAAVRHGKAGALNQAWRRAEGRVHRRTAPVVVHPVVAGFAVVFLAIGLRSFRRRVLS
jgi:hypothetical protein